MLSSKKQSCPTWQFLNKIHIVNFITLTQGIAELGIYPAVDPLDSTSRIMDPNVIGMEHYQIARGVQKILQDYKSLQDIIAILGMDELSEEVGFCFACFTSSMSHFFLLAGQDQGGEGEEG